MKKSLCLLLLIVLPIALVAPLESVASADQSTLSYSVKEVRAYAEKVSLTPEAIQAAGAQTTVRNKFIEQCNTLLPPGSERDQCVENAPPPSCTDNTETSYDECDKQQYNQNQNCPIPPGIGISGPLPAITVPTGSAQSGKAGFTTPGPQPPQASAVRLSDILSLGRLSHTGTALEAGGLASKTYVDLNGRQEPDAHTESDAFSAGRSTFEERCYPVTSNGTYSGTDSYTHLISRSSQTPETYQFGECVKNQCTFASELSGANRSVASRASTIVSLAERDGKLTGQLVSSIEGFNAGGGVFTAEAITTYITFSTDGSAAGLTWSVISEASGAKTSGIPVTVPQGTLLPVTPGFSVGMAAPWVDAPAGGEKLTIIAPGLIVATEQQTFYYAGGELFAGMGRITPVIFKDIAPAPTFTTKPTGTFPILGTGPVNIPSLPEAAIEEPKRTIAIRRVGAGPLPAEAILGIGSLALLLMLGGWMQRFSWARRLYRIQPFKFFYWAYRAFART